MALACMMAMEGRVAAQGVGGFEYHGITHVSWWFDEYGYAGATASRQDMAATNANWGGVLVTWYQPGIASNSIAASSTKTPTDDAVRTAIREMHSTGMKVMLKPHVDTNDGRWRGDINPADKDAWFASYTAFITIYARMAADERVEMLCVGTELKSVSGSANRARWNAVIDAVRTIYSGTLTYAANATSAGDEFTSVSFWDRIDLIGLDGYFPLTNRASPSLADLVAAWRRNRSSLDVIAAVKNVSDAYGKPVIFTEIGYRSSAGANIEPWEFSRMTAYDPMEQRNCVDAAFTAWSPHSSWMKGLLWWAWPVPVPSPTDQDYRSAWEAGGGGVAGMAIAGGPSQRSYEYGELSGRLDCSGSDCEFVGCWFVWWSGGCVGDSAAQSKLGDTKVTINGIPALLYFVSPEQVNAFVPLEVAQGPAIAEVVSSSGIALTRIEVRAAGPGIFTTNGQGTGDGAILDGMTFALVSSAQPIAAGRYIAIYCTGLGL